MPSLTDEKRALIASLGGVELVLSALRNHSSHVDMQVNGLGALQNLAANGSLAQRRWGVVHTVWMPLIIIIRAACDHLMSTTCLTDKNRVLIASMGGVELVLSALRNHSSHASIQASGLVALQNVAEGGVVLDTRDCTVQPALLTSTKPRGEH